MTDSTEALFAPDTRVVSDRRLSRVQHCIARRGAAGRRSETDITPSGGEMQWGYESRKNPTTGTLDPLYARVVVLEAGKPGWPW